MKKIYIAGNWKMNKTISEVILYFDKVVEFNKLNNIPRQILPIVFPPAIYLDTCSEKVKNTDFFVGCQDVSRFEEGAYTGEISASMLHSIGINYCIVGHSERRQYYNETNKDVNLKAKSLIKQGIIPLICIGEKEDERNEGKTMDVILKQLEECFEGISPDNQFLIAYEPVWAIGTGRTATPEMAQEVHKYIRNWLTKNYGRTVSERISLLYGGSIKPDNFASLLQQEDIDGGLIGGASLSPESFIEFMKIGVNTIGA